MFHVKHGLLCCPEVAPGVSRDWAPAAPTTVGEGNPRKLPAPSTAGRREARHPSRSRASIGPALPPAAGKPPAAGPRAEPGFRPPAPGQSVGGAGAPSWGAGPCFT